MITYVYDVYVNLRSHTHTVVYNALIIFYKSYSVNYLYMKKNSLQPFKWLVQL